MVCDVLLPFEMHNHDDHVLSQLLCQAGSLAGTQLQMHRRYHMQELLIELTEECGARR